VHVVDGTDGLVQRCCRRFESVQFEFPSAFSLEKPFHEMIFAALKSIVFFLLERTLSVTESGLEIVEDNILPLCSKWVERFSSGGSGLISNGVNLNHSGPVNGVELQFGEGGTQSPSPAQGPEFLQDFSSSKSRESDFEDLSLVAKQLQQVRFHQLRI
jgi:hypothetical protein